MKKFIFILTNKCNLNCFGCLRLRNKKELQLSIIKKILPQLKELGYDTISLTGGEPYLHSKFKDVIYEIVKNKLNFGILSNGILYKKYLHLYNKYPESFKYITFSLDGADKETHEKIRGKNAFEPVINAIKEFNKIRKKTKQKIRISVNCCLNKINYNQINNLVNLLSKLNVDVIRFLAMMPNGYNNQVILTEKEKLECTKQIINLSKIKKIQINYLTSLYGENKINFCEGFDLTYLSVNPEGNLIFCCDTMGNGVTIGSLEKYSLKDLISKARTLSNDLITLRSYLLLNNINYDGRDTCLFCNKSLKKNK